MFRSLIFFLSIFAVNLLANNINPVKTINIDTIFQVDINSTINPATFEHLKKSMKIVDQHTKSLLLIKMSTPGGLVSTTKEILNLISESSTPVIVWIAPAGSSATSAGALIASGAHYLYMSEGTNIGAATPITMSGDLGKQPNKENDGSDLRAKAVNDLAALVKAICEMRNRDAASYALMIEHAKSFSAKDAEKKNIIDKVANNVDEIYQDINSRTIKFKDASINFQISKNVELKKIEYSLGDSLLNVFSSPELAYILFLIGAALIYFELQAPGGFVAGAFGVISIILSGIGFHVLPVNFGGVGLLVTSFVLFILEINFASFGLLAIAGLASLIFGSLILFETPDSLVTLNHTVMVSTIASIIITFGLISYFLIRTRVKNAKKDFFIPIGHTGVIQKVLPPLEGKHWYMAKINGVLWKVVSAEIHSEGQMIQVDSQVDNSLILNIASVRTKK